VIKAALKDDLRKTLQHEEANTFEGEPIDFKVKAALLFALFSKSKIASFQFRAQNRPRAVMDKM
jgi:hypothetical protein